MQCRINSNELKSSSPKKQRVEKHKQAAVTNDKTRTNQTKNVFVKVLCQKDYLRLICHFMKITDIFKTVVLISKYHHNFVNANAQEKLIQTCVDYDGYKSAFKSLGIFQFTKDDAAEDNTDSVSQKLSIVYAMSSWDDLVSTVEKSNYIHMKNKLKLCNQERASKYKYNIDYLLLLTNVALMKHFLPIVKQPYNHICSNCTTKVLQNVGKSLGQKHIVDNCKTCTSRTMSINICWSLDI